MASTCRRASRSQDRPWQLLAPRRLPSLTLTSDIFMAVTALPLVLLPRAHWLAPSSLLLGMVSFTIAMMMAANVFLPQLITGQRRDQELTLWRHWMKIKCRKNLVFVPGNLLPRGFLALIGCKAL